MEDFLGIDWQVSDTINKMVNIFGTMEWNVTIWISFLAK